MSSREKSPELTHKEKKHSKKRSRSREHKSKRRDPSREREKKKKKHSKSMSRSVSREERSRQKKRESRWSSVTEEVIQPVISSNTIQKPDPLSKNPSELLAISEKLKQINPLLGLNTSSVQNWTNNLNPNILHTLNDTSKIKRKIFIPKMEGVNFVGLLLGPKGCYQKRLEQQSGCKILIRGKGTQKDGVPQQPDDDEEQHALIVGETEEHVNKAQYLIEKVLFADAETRNKIKEEQLKASQEMRSEQFFNSDISGKVIPQVIDDSLMTPYGPPDKNARIIPVPNDCVGLIIGKNGETIRRLHRETSCKIQIAKKEIPNTEVRNVFIEGPLEKYEFARKMIEDIVAEQQRLKQNFSHLGEINPFPGPYEHFKVLNKFVGLIIGKNGETVRNLHQKTGCFIFIPKDSKPGEDFRNIELSGKPENIAECKKEMDNLIQITNSTNINMIFDQSKPNEAVRNLQQIPSCTNDINKSLHNYSINSQNIPQMINPQTNCLINNITNIRPVVPPNQLFQIPYGFPVVNLGQNYVNNINFTQNFNNFNHFNNIPTPAFVAFNPYQQVYPVPMNYQSGHNNLMVPRHLSTQNFAQSINPLYLNCNKSTQAVNTQFTQENNISQAINSNNHLSQLNPTENNSKLANIKEMDESNKYKTDKINEKDKGCNENDEFIPNPTLSYIYGGHLFNKDSKENK